MEPTSMFAGESSNLVKGCFVFIMFMLTIAVNVEDNVMARLGIEGNLVLSALLATVITGLLMHRNLLLIVLVLFLSVCANMPADFMLSFGLDRDYFTGILAAVVLVPLVARLLD